MIWKMLLLRRVAFSVVILLQYQCILTADGQENLESGWPGNYPPARRQPQGRDTSPSLISTAIPTTIPTPTTTLPPSPSSTSTTTATSFALGAVEPKDNFPSSSSRNTTSVAKSNYANRSRFVRRPGLVLTLSLRQSKDVNNNDKTKEIITHSTSPLGNEADGSEDEITDIRTTIIGDITNASFDAVQEQTTKVYRILDRLKSLTNLKMKSSSSGNVGIARSRFPILNNDNKNENVSTKNEMTSSQTRTTSFVTSGAAEAEKAASTPVESTTENSADATTSTVPTEKTLTTKAGGHINHSSTKPEATKLKFRSSAPPPVVLKVGNLTNLRNSIVNGSKKPDSNEEQLSFETRHVVTADQIGGNRPTRTPFHFTTSTAPPITTTDARVYTAINRYQKQYSPHNHIYAPTQDPVSAAQHEDLNVEDFQDFRVANLLFGSKVGADVPTPPSLAEESAPTRPPILRPNPPTYSSNPVVKTTPVKTKKTKPPLPKSVPLPLPDSASSGVKNSHIHPHNDNNLPFYKEPGGVFKEHSHPSQYPEDNDEEPNQVNHRFNDRAPGVKYAPKGPSALPQTHYATHRRNNQRQQQHQSIHSQLPPPGPGPAYITVTQQPIYLAPAPIIHPAYNYAPPAPVIQQNQHQHRIPQPPPQHNNYYPQPVPAPYYPVPQQQPIYNNPAPNSGFVPVLTPQNYQHPHTHPQPLPAPPVQPIYHSYNSPSPQHFSNGYNFGQPAQNAPKPKDNNNKDYYKPPRRDDPESDTFYGDPLPSREKTKVANAPKVKPKRPSRKQEEEETEEEPEEEEEEPEQEEEPERESRKPSRPPPSPPRKEPPRRNPPSRERDREEGYDRDRNREQFRDRHRDDEDQQPRRGGLNANRPPGYDEYDSDPNEHIDDFAQPNTNNDRPHYDDDSVEPTRDFVDLGNNFNEGQRSRKPFNPSPADYGPIRPSLSDNSPNFDHPNIQYPNRRQNPGLDYDPRGFGVGYGPPMKQDLLLDPIYTRTIKQYDDENKPTPPSPNRNRNEESYPQPDEEHDDIPDRGGSERGPPRRAEERSRESEEEEEEEEEPPEEEKQEERPRKKQEQQEEEEEEPEEEEEEETQNKEKRPEEPKQEEEEEEEEEEEQAPEKSKRSGKKEPKKPPPKKPKKEKSGNLDEDISGIEREFGGIFVPGGAQRGEQYNRLQN